MSILYIGKPYIEKNNEKVRLCSEIDIKGKKKVLYYEVDQVWADALCEERSDAFVVSLLQYSMANGYDIQWETPVTDRLVYQLRTIFIPVISSKYNKIFSKIELIGETTANPIQKKTVGCCNRSVRWGGFVLFHSQAYRHNREISKVDTFIICVYFE